MKTTLPIIALSLLALCRATAAPNSFESELFPPDFLMNQHEAIGLNETQLHEIQSVVQDAQPKFETLKSELEDRGKSLQDAVHQPTPDMAKTEELLRAFLPKENEMKLLQFHLLLTLRSKLTPDQVAKARELRAQSTSLSNSNSNSNASDPNEGLRDRLQKKFEQLKTAVQARAAGGQPPDDIIAKAHEIQQLVQDGKPQEAEKQLDALLATLPGAKPNP
jgi:Spy/CpxP family protein refolding chaperone